MKSLISTILFLLLTPFTTHAQSSKGNGGNAVVCYTDASMQNVASVELFDYWEMAQVHAQLGGPRFGDARLSILNHAKIALARVATFDPGRAERYLKQVEEILKYLPEYLANDVDLTPINDDNPLRTPSGLCKKVQFAVQLTTPVIGRRRFQINRELFQSAATPNAVKAGLLLHEAIYREALALGQQNSDRVRYFNFVIATGALDVADDATRSQYDLYIKTLQETGFSFDRRGCIPHWSRFLDKMVITRDDSAGREATISCRAVEVRSGILRGSLPSGGKLVYDSSPDVDDISFLDINGHGGSIEGAYLEAKINGRWIRASNAVLAHKGGRTHLTLIMPWMNGSYYEMKVGITRTGIGVDCMSTSPLVLDRQGEIRGCDVPFRRRTRVTLHSGQTVAVWGVTYAEDRSYIESLKLSDAAELPIEGGPSIFFNEYRPIALNARGEVIRDRQLTAEGVTNGFQKVLLGQDVTIPNFLDVNERQFKAEFTYPAPASFDGRAMIVAGTWNNHRDPRRDQVLVFLGKTFCEPVAQKLRVSCNSKASFVLTTEERIGAYREFYDPLTQSVTPAFDQDVTIIRSVNCSCEGWLDWR